MALKYKNIAMCFFRNKGNANNTKRGISFKQNIHAKQITQNL